MAKKTKTSSRSRSYNSRRSASSRAGQRASQMHPMERFRTLLQSRTFSIVLFVLIVFITVSLTKSVLRKNEIQQQIKELEDEIASIESSNTDLNALLEYFNSSEYQEKEARTKLGLRSEGETLLLIPQPEVTPETFDPLTESSGQEVVESSNISKWFDYFFKS